MGGGGAVYICSVLVACGGFVRSGLLHRLNGIGHMGCICMCNVDGARMGVACAWMAHMWATRVDGAVVGAIALGSARCCASEGARMHASGRGIWYGLYSGEGVNEGASGSQLSDY